VHKLELMEASSAHSCQRVLDQGLLRSKGLPVAVSLWRGAALYFHARRMNLLVDSGMLTSWSKVLTQPVGYWE
jgi:hypothetical protein